MNTIDQYKNFHKILSDHNTYNPSDIAIEYKTESISYAELHNITNQLAGCIMEHAKEMNGDIYIPVLADRSPTMIFSVLSVMKAGFVFIPLDVDYPENRLSLMLSIVQSKILLTDERYIDKAIAIKKKLGYDVRIIVMKTGNAPAGSPEHQDIYYLTPDKKNPGSDINTYNQYLYIYFTSGSTGTPKAILGKHQSLLNFMKWQINEFNIKSDCRIPQITTPCFDVFLRDIFVPLCTGGTICVPDSRELILDTGHFVTWIAEKRITHMHVVPTLLRTILNNLKQNNKKCFFENLQHVISSSEVLKGEDIRLFYEFMCPGTRLANLYGTTETTLIKSIYHTSKEDGDKLVIPIGKPITNAEILILDKDLKKAGPGEINEIYIRTPDMTAGYINQPELMKKVFIKDPYSDDPGALMYKTGDMGRVLPDGNMIWLGRIDHQIKIRGIRIELSDIEAHLLRRDEIKEVVVVGIDIKGEKTLCAYLVAEGKLNIEKIRDYLHKNLPQYMVPAYIVQIDGIAFLPNGKVDRSKLPDPLLLIKQSIDDVILPKDEVEVKLLSIAKNIFESDEIHLGNDFFAIGGHSLKAILLMTHVNREFEIKLTIRDIFDNKILKNLARVIKEHHKIPLSAIPKAGTMDQYPLTSSQQRLFLLNLIENIRTSYNKPHLFIIRGPFDRKRCEKTFADIIKRHDALRTSFTFTDNGPVQIFHPHVDFTLEWQEKNITIKDDDILIHEEIKPLVTAFIRSFDLSRAPIFRATCVRCDENTHLLMWDSHHIICDGISEEIINKEFTELYNRQEVSSFEIEYKDYVVWQSDIELSDALADQEQYWLRMFHTTPEPLHIHTDLPRPKKQSHRGAYFRYTLDENYAKDLKSLCRKMNSTLFMVLFSAFNILISNYARQKDIVIGLPISVRKRKELENIIGMFVNTLAIRTLIDPAIDFKEFLSSVRSSVIETFQHQEYQFEKLIEKINVTRDLSRNPLFDVMFIMQNMDHESIIIENAHVAHLFCHNGNSKFDLTLNVEENGNTLTFVFEYCADLFVKETIERLTGHYVEIIKEISHNPGILIKDISLLTEKERSLDKEYNKSELVYDRNVMVHHLFEEMAHENPDAIAVVCNNQPHTYDELNRKANQLAHTLRQKGIGRNVLAGVLVRRSFEMIVSMMAILKAGGAYVPLDPNFPRNRIINILDDSNCRLIISGKELISEFELTCESLDIYDESAFSSQESNPRPDGTADDLMYLIYTSGSTGKPKGVMIQHRNVVNFIHGMTRAIDFKETHSFLGLTTISFDIFVLELFIPLSQGKRVVLANENECRDPALLGNLIKEQNVDVVQSTPSRIEMYFPEKEQLKLLEGVSRLIIGGEAFSLKLLRHLKNLKNTRIYNVYGPTETTVWSSVREVTGEDRITIGFPIANTRLYVCNAFDLPVPVGIPGELLIGGDGVAAGYYHKDELTAERFVVLESLEKDRVYKTGDLVRRLPDGDIEFLGRIDNQVKIRGFRVELEEIEKYISEYPGIEHSVCAVKGNDGDTAIIKTTNGAQRMLSTAQLVAYYIAENEISVSEIREYLFLHLPDYMVPEIFIKITEIPYTPNNKIDKKRLPEPLHYQPAVSTEFQSWRNETEKVIHDIWTDVLRIEQAGIHDNFFDLGGNSFLLIKMHRIIEEKFPKMISVTDLFAYPSISKLAGFIHTKENPGAAGEQIDIPLLPLPDTYFITDEMRDSSLLEYEIDKEIHEKLENLSKKYNTTINLLYLGCYVYMLYQISEKENIPVAYVHDNSSIIFLEINTASVSHFEGLVREIKSKMDSDEARQLPGTVLEKHIVNKGEGGILPVYNSTGGTTIEVNDTIDVILTSRNNNRTPSLFFDYNSNKLNGPLMDDCFHSLVELLAAIADESGEV